MVAPAFEYVAAGSYDEAVRLLADGELFVGYWTTALAGSEIITDVLIPVSRPRQGWSFHEMVRRGG